MKRKVRRTTLGILLISIAMFFVTIIGISNTGIEKVLADDQTVSGGANTNTQTNLIENSNSLFPLNFNDALDFSKLKQTRGEAAETSLPQFGVTNLSNFGETNSQSLGNLGHVADVPTKTEDGKEILQVKTTATADSVDTLTNKTYQSEDSLVKPVIKDISVQTRSSNLEADIIIPKVNISVQDGTSSWDTDNNPGHDSSPTNGIVRSWDTVTYLVAFNIQNTNLKTNYTDIRYRVTSNLSNAVTLQSDGQTPQVNASIVNGTIYNQDGSPYTSGNNGYSEGIMESTITNTGQVFVPVSVAVQGAPNGLNLQPTFKVEIVDAKNVDTGETVTFDNTYDTNDFAALTPAKETVSATPSVGVTLTKGVTAVGNQAKSYFSDTNWNNNINAWNVGVTETLRPLSGRASDDFRGSTYPTQSVNYTLKLKGSYVTNSGSTGAIGTSSGSDSYEISVQAYAPAVLNRTQNFLRPTTGYQVPSLVSPGLKSASPLAIPNAITRQIYTAIPASGTAVQGIGVYDSGTFSITNNGSGINSTATVNNNGFIGINNPYTYNMTGTVYSGANRPFSTLETLIRYDASRVYNNGISNKWSSYTISLYVDNVTADGVSQANSSQLDYSTNIALTGGYDAAISLLEGTKTDWVNTDTLNGNKVVDYVNWPENLSQSNSQQSDQNFGDVKLNGGQKIYATQRQSWAGLISPTNTIDGYYGIVQWDPSAFSFDSSRGFITRFLKNSAWTYTKYNVWYGVATNFSKTAPVTKRSLGYDATVNQYTWYSSYASVPDPTKISAVRTESAWTSAENLNWGYQGFGVPLIVNPNVKGATTPAGNPLIVTSAEKIGISTSTTIPGPYYDPVINGGSSDLTNNTGKAGDNGYYIPTTFNTDGSVNNKNGTINGTSITQHYWNGNAESAFVRAYSILSQTSVDQSIYDPKDVINVKLRGLPNGNSSTSYGASLKTTLPIGIDYTPGSAVDGQGNLLPEPTIIKNSDGTTQLTWYFKNISLTFGLEVDFKATTDLGAIFKNPGFSSQGVTKAPLGITTYAGIYLMNNLPDQTTGNTGDTSGTPDSVRSSSAQFNERLVQQLILDKTANKSAIDVGNIDAANSKVDSSNDVTYTITAVNNSAQVVNGLTLLDVLPYNGDTRGSKFNGGYTVVNASVKASVTNSDGSVGATPTLTFSTQKPSSTGINEKTNSNTSINGTVVTPSTDVSKATMFQVTNATPVDVGATVTLTLTIRPDNGQKAGDLYTNTAGMNSAIDQAVYSQPTHTKVYGRDLSGFAWVDKDKDGLYQKGEQLVSNVPVKLYRTSTVNKDFTNQLVKTDMDGNSFVDSSGNSTVLTQTDGSYTFGNLPEGSYIAEFEIDGLIHKQNFMVTAMNVGTDVSINSKADQKSFRTESYEVSVPDISSLPSVVGADSMRHMQYVNLGVTAPPDTVLPYTGANKAMQIGLMVASGLALMGLLVFGGKYQWLEMKKKRSSLD